MFLNKRKREEKPQASGSEDFQDRRAKKQRTNHRSNANGNYDEIGSFENCVAEKKTYEAYNIIKNYLDALYNEDTEQYDVSPDVIPRAVPALNQLFQQLQKNNDIMKLLAVKDYIIALEPDSLTLGQYNQLLELCFKKQMDEKGMELYEALSKQPKIKADENTYTILIQGYSKCKRMAEASKFFKSLKKSMKGKPQVKTYNALIEGYARTGNYQKAQGILDKMKREGVNPTVQTYNAMIDGCIEADNMKQAEEILESLKAKKDGIEPDAYSYLPFMKAQIEYFHQTEKAFQMLATLIKEQKKTVPVAIFNNLMKTLVKVQQLNKTSKLFAMMKEAGVKPSCTTYNPLLSYYVEQQDFDSAEKLLESMQKDGVTPDAIIFTGLIRGYAKSGDVESANDAYVRMIKAGIAPTAATEKTMNELHHGDSEAYKSLAREHMHNIKEVQQVKGKRNQNQNQDKEQHPIVTTVKRHLRNNQPHAAYDLVKKLFEESIIPPAYVLDKLIIQLSNLKDYTSLVNLFDYAEHWNPSEGEEQNQLQFSKDNYCFLIRTCFECGNTKKGIEYFNLVRSNKEKLGLDAKCLHAVISGYAKQGEINKRNDEDKFQRIMKLAMNKANEVFQQAVTEDKVSPDMSCINTLIEGYGKAGDMDKAYEIYNQIKGQFNMLPTKDTYHLMLTYLSKYGNRKIAEKVLEDIKSEKMDSLTLNTFTAMVNAIDEKKYQQEQTMKHNIKWVKQVQRTERKAKAEESVPKITKDGYAILRN